MVAMYVHFNVSFYDAKPHEVALVVAGAVALALIVWFFARKRS